MNLNNITGVIVDTFDVKRALKVFEKCDKLGVTFEKSLIIKSDWKDTYPALALVKSLINYKVDTVNILPNPIKNKEEYSFFIMKKLYNYIATSHMLIMQWDGYILNPEVWDPKWLEYDYIGARWGFYNDYAVVGNGGFSLRSKKLMEIVATDPKIVEYHPEDNKICRCYRPYLEEHYGLKFAPPEVADLFSDENSHFKHKTFGWHGGVR